MMRSTASILFLLGALLGLAGCAAVQAPVVPQRNAVDRSVIPKKLPAVADEAGYRQMLKVAREWQRKAQSVDGEWRDVQLLLERAEQEAAAGDYRKAVELAEAARFQAEMGYRQMRAQEKVDNPPFLYY